MIALANRRAEIFGKSIVASIPFSSRHRIIN